MNPLHIHLRNDHDAVCDEEVYDVGCDEVYGEGSAPGDVQLGLSVGEYALDDEVHRVSLSPDVKRLDDGDDDEV